jgi:hypothetical protein
LDAEIDEEEKIAEVNGKWEEREIKEKENLLS